MDASVLRSDGLVATAAIKFSEGLSGRALSPVLQRKRTRMLAEKQDSEKQAWIGKVSGGYEGSLNYFEAPAEIRKNRDVTLAAVGNWGVALEYADEDFKQDKDVVLAAAKCQPLALKFASHGVSSDIEFRALWVQAVGTRGREGFLAFEQAPKVVQVDRNVALAAVRNVGYALEFMNTALQADKEVVLAAVQSDPLAIQFAHPALQCCDELKDSWVTAVGIGGQEGVLAYKTAPTAVRGAREVALAAITSDARALEYAPDALREDGAFVLEAARFSPESTRHAKAAALAAPEVQRLWASKVRDPATGHAAYAKAPQFVRSNVDLTLEAVRANGLALEFADPWLQSERTVVLAAVAQNGKAMGFADDSLREDLSFVLEAVEKSAAVVTKAHPDVQAHPELSPAWAAVVATGGHSGAYDFRDAPEEVKCDWDVALAAVGNCARSLTWVGESLCSNPDFVAEALAANVDAKRYAALKGVD